MQFVEKLENYTSVRFSEVPLGDSEKWLFLEDFQIYQEIGFWRMIAAQAGWGI